MVSMSGPSYWPLVLAVAATLATPSRAQVATGVAARLQDAALREAIDTAFASDGRGVCLVARSGRLVLHRAHGRVADRGPKVTSATLFDIGTLAAPFTVAALLRLSMSGRLELTDPVARHLPDLPDDWHDVTVRDLVSHRAALPSDVSFVAGDAADRGRFVAHLLREPPRYRPGRYTGRARE